MTTEHYFSDQPSSPNREQEVSLSFGDRKIEAVGGSGTFSAGKLDAGTRLLLDWLEKQLKNSDMTSAAAGKSQQSSPTTNLLDLGCGWGAISLCLAIGKPGSQVWSVDVNSRALELASQNAIRNKLPNIHAVHPEEVPNDLGFEEIWSNPPIRIGKQQLHDLIRRWVHRLNPTGSAHFVIAKQLGADSFENWLTHEFPERNVVRSMRNANYRILTLGPSN